MEKDRNIDEAGHMPENGNWLNALNELRVENIRLKDQLSAAISQDVSHEFVEKAEQFQQRFVEKDQVIDLLRHDIIMLHTVKSNADTHQRQFTVLEKDMKQLIHEFYQMKTSFASFINMNNAG